MSTTTPIKIADKIDTGPINIAAVLRDDRTVDALSRGDLPDQMDPLVAVLFAWRTSVEDSDLDPDRGRSLTAWWGIATEVARSEVLADRLLAEHAPTPDRLCRRCGRGGYGTPMVPWPCSLAGVALVARQLRQETDQ